MVPLGHEIVDQNLTDVLDKKAARPSLELCLNDIERESIRLQQRAILTKIHINKCPAISSLPTETLSRIFMLCCQPKYNIIGGLESQGICPLRLSAVCKAWRDLAWITSLLWSYIFLIKPKASAPHLEELLTSWLARSGSHPLSIRYDAPEGGYLLPCLLGVAPRWANVAIFLPVQSFSTMEKLTVFPLLEHLSIRTSGRNNRDWGVLEDLEIFNSRNMPKISRLHVPTFLRRLFLYGPVCKLTTFSVSSIFNDDAFQVLCLAIFLETFVANNLETRGGGGLSGLPEPVLLSRLRRLVLKEVDPPALAELLPCVSTPNIEDLTIELFRRLSEPAASVSNFMTSLPKLQRLKMKFPHPNSDWIVRCILNIPSLTELHVHASRSAFSILIPSLGPPESKEGTSECLPLLEDLTLGFEHGWYNGGIEGIPEMLTSRSSGLSSATSRLKSAVIFTNSYSDDGDFDAFKTAALGDLELTIVTNRKVHRITKPNVKETNL